MVEPTTINSCISIIISPAIHKDTENCLGFAYAGRRKSYLYVRIRIACTVELISGQMADCNRGVGTNRWRDDQFEPTVLQVYEHTL